MNLSRDNEAAKLNFVLGGACQGHYTEGFFVKRSSLHRRGKNLNRQNIALGDESMNISSLGNK